MRRRVGIRLDDGAISRPRPPPVESTPPHSSSAAIRNEVPAPPVASDDSALQDFFSEIESLAAAGATAQPGTNGSCSEAVSNTAPLDGLSTVNDELARALLERGIPAEATSSLTVLSSNMDAIINSDLSRVARLSFLRGVLHAAVDPSVVFDTFQQEKPWLLQSRQIVAEPRSAPFDELHIVFVSSAPTSRLLRNLSGLQSIWSRSLLLHLPAKYSGVVALADAAPTNSIAAEDHPTTVSDAATAATTVSAAISASAQSVDPSADSPVVAKTTSSLLVEYESEEDSDCETHPESASVSLTETTQDCTTHSNDPGASATSATSATAALVATSAVMLSFSNKAAAAAAFSRFFVPDVTASAAAAGSIDASAIVTADAMASEERTVPAAAAVASFTPISEQHAFGDSERADWQGWNVLHFSSLGAGTGGSSGGADIPVSGYYRYATKAEYEAAIREFAMPLCRKTASVS